MPAPWKARLETSGGDRGDHAPRRANVDIADIESADVDTMTETDPTPARRASDEGSVVANSVAQAVPEHQHAPVAAHLPVPQHLPEPAKRSWAELGIAVDAAGAVFEPDSVSGLPAPVARWLRHVIATGTPLRSGVRFSMHGDIRIKRWMPFTAEQILAPTGYIWAAETGRFPVRIKGFDRYSAATGEMSWRIFGRVPVVTATGPDVARSAAGRLASELLGLTPTGALSPAVTWRSVDDHQAVATVTIDGWEHEVTVDIDDEGRLRTISLPRWANPDEGGFQLHTFGVIFDGELAADGYTLPLTIRAGWWPDTPRWDEGEFFRATIDRAQFF